MRRCVRVFTRPCESLSVYSCDPDGPRPFPTVRGIEAESVARISDIFRVRSDMVGEAREPREITDEK